jgi:hypothetical protein
MSDDITNQQFNEMLGALSDVRHAMQEASVMATVIDPRMRRLMRAIADIGMQVPDNWVRVETDDEGNPVGASFAPMSWKALDRIVCLFEDIAENRPITVIQQQSGPTLFDPAPPPTPPIPRSATSFHMTVPQ